MSASRRKESDVDPIGFVIAVVILGIAFGLYKLYQNIGRVGLALILLAIVGLCAGAVVLRYRKRVAEAVAAEEFRRNQEAAAEELRRNQEAADELRRNQEAELRRHQQAKKRAKVERLVEKYGEEVAACILIRKIWIGMSAEQLLESWGEPCEKDYSISKGNIEETWKYWQYGKNRFRNRLFLKDQRVVGSKGNAILEDSFEPDVDDADGQVPDEKRKPEVEEEWYETLEISPTASPEEINAAWRTKITKNHPDRVSALDEEFRSLAEQRTKRLNAAREKGLSKYKHAARNPQDPTSWGTVGRNEPCPCGSGKKFKHCHGRYQ